MNRILFSLLMSLTVVSVGEARIRMSEDIRTLGEGSYLLIEEPLLIRKGTTSLRAARSRVKADRQGRVPGPSCDIRLSKATGMDIFKNHFILKAGTKLYLASENNELLFTNENQSVKIPLDCRYMVRQKKGFVTASRFTIQQFSKVFSFVGTLYMAPPSKKQQMADL